MAEAVAVWSCFLCAAMDVGASRTEELLQRGLAKTHPSVDRYKHSAAYKAAEQAAKDAVR